MTLCKRCIGFGVIVLAAQDVGEPAPQDEMECPDCLGEGREMSEAKRGSILAARRNAIKAQANDGDAPF